jgi:hypothetical protein
MIPTGPSAFCLIKVLAIVKIDFADGYIKGSLALDEETLAQEALHCLCIAHDALAAIAQLFKMNLKFVFKNFI